ncbi:MAG: hypothetical protein ACI8RD_013395 [Bacillariaceae sp.]|jgi:hypothetical protein
MSCQRLNDEDIKFDLQLSVDCVTHTQTHTTSSTYIEPPQSTRLAIIQSNAWIETTKDYGE